jgi:hypothetical protein
LVGGEQFLGHDPVRFWVSIVVTNSAATVASEDGTEKQENRKRPAGFRCFFIAVHVRTGNFSTPWKKVFHSVEKIYTATNPVERRRTSWAVHGFFIWFCVYKTAKDGIMLLQILSTANIVSFDSTGGTKGSK